jgi:hypothetical protein
MRDYLLKVITGRGWDGTEARHTWGPASPAVQLQCRKAKEGAARELALGDWRHRNGWLGSESPALLTATNSTTARTPTDSSW